MLGVRAIYQNGQLQLLEPVNLMDGEEVEIQILSPKNPLNDLLSDLIVPQSDNTSEFDESELVKQIDNLTQGITLSDIVIDERQSGR
jgi:predicted DNA-binding antitoxin AbrB/MazE fold protein